MDTPQLTLDVKTKDFTCSDRVVSIDLSLNLGQIAGLHLEEINDAGIILNNNVPFQLCWTTGIEEDFRLLILLLGKTPANSIRHYRLCLDTEIDNRLMLKPQIQVCEMFYQGQQAYHIKTSSATYIYHKQGGGFAALLCPDGKDWISYRLKSGSAGSYRGIPNIKYPDNYFHPGENSTRSRILTQGPIYFAVHTETIDGLCESIWEFYPTYITLTLLKTPTPYWFLYEGTPGGKLDELGDFIVRSDGTRTLANQCWEAVLDPGWVYFGASDTNHILFFAQHDTELCLSSYWPMEGNMTVFGFGRKGLDHYLEKVPAQYTIGLVNTGTFDQVATHIESFRQDIEVVIREGNTA